MRPRVVICGSFHRDPEGLARVFRELEATGCRVLSPISLDFSNRAEPVVKTPSEYNLNITELEKFHLRAIRDSDFIYIHAPGGHVGISTSFELGFSHALSKPVFCKNMLKDEMLQTIATKIGSVFEALEFISLA